MSKGKGAKKKPQIEVQRLSLIMLDVIDKLRELERKQRGLINYSEYLAKNLDTTIDYIEMTGRTLSRNSDPSIFGFNTFSQTEKTETFNEFRNSRGDGETT
jgi:hypothetical protein